LDAKSQIVEGRTGNCLRSELMVDWELVLICKDAGRWMYGKESGKRVVEGTEPKAGNYVINKVRTRHSRRTSQGLAGTVGM
jgi:hypothetical protein